MHFAFNFILKKLKSIFFLIFSKKVTFFSYTLEQEKYIFKDKDCNNNFENNNLNRKKVNLIDFI